MIELTHIAWPGVLDQDLHGGAVEPREVLSISLGVRAKKVCGECPDVFAAFAQRRQMNLNRVQPK